MARSKLDCSRSLKLDYVKMVEDLGIEKAKMRFTPMAKPVKAAKKKNEDGRVEKQNKKRLQIRKMKKKCGKESVGRFSKKKSKATGSARESKSKSDKQELLNLAARVSVDLAALRQELDSDQQRVTAATIVPPGKGSSDFTEQTPAARRELKDVTNKLAMRSFALTAVATRLEEQQLALETAGDASAKQLARLKRNALDS